MFINQGCSSVAKFFYADCVISDIHQPGFVDEIYTALINGRETKKLWLTRDFYRYLTGVGKGTTNRVWFVVLGGLLTVIAMENSAGERLTRPNPTGHIFFDVVIRPLCLGFITWIVAWVPVAIYSAVKTGDMFGYPGASVALGALAALLLGAHALRTHTKLANPSAWEQGDLSLVTNALKPEFGSALAAKKE